MVAQCLSHKTYDAGRGLKGVAFTDALDSRPTCPALPEYGTNEYDSTPLDRLHASMPALLSAWAAQDAQPASEETPLQQVRFYYLIACNRLSGLLRGSYSMACHCCLLLCHQGCTNPLPSTCHQARLYQSALQRLLANFTAAATSCPA